MMNCSQIQYDLPDFLRGKLTDSEGSEVSQHVASCLQCGSEVDRLRIVMDEIEASVVIPPGNIYWGSLLPRIHDSIERGSMREIPAWMLRIALPLAAAAVLFVFLARVPSVQLEGDLGNLDIVVRQLKPDELDEIADAHVISEGLDSSDLLSEDESLASNEQEALRLLLSKEEGVFSYDGLDAESIIMTLEDPEVSEIVARLNQRTTIN